MATSTAEIVSCKLSKYYVYHPIEVYRDVRPRRVLELASSLSLQQHQGAVRVHGNLRWRTMQ